MVNILHPGNMRGRRCIFNGGVHPDAQILGKAPSPGAIRMYRMARVLDQRIDRFGKPEFFIRLDQPLHVPIRIHPLTMQLLPAKTVTECWINEDWLQWVQDGADPRIGTMVPIVEVKR